MGESKSYQARRVRIFLFRKVRSEIRSLPKTGVVGVMRLDHSGDF